MSVSTRKVDLHDRAHLYLAGLLLGIVAATFFSRIWDPDFFWHLATGRWIVLNMTLPAHDPFTPFSYGTGREALILKGYWLAQVSYHFFHALFGTFGLALLKSATFVALFALVFHYHQIKKSSFPWVLLCLLPLYESLLHFRGDRPNIFSFLFFAGLLYLLETRRWQLLPLLMLVWANVHGGYLLGDVVIVLYLGALALSRRGEVSPRVAGWGLLAVGVSFINPLGMTPLFLMFKLEGSQYQQATFEFLSPVRLALDYHDFYLGYFLALFLALGGLCFCRKDAHWAQLALLLLTACISLQHARYIPFFVITCAFFLPHFFNRVTLPALGRQFLLYGSTTLIVLLFTADLMDGRALTAGLEPGRFPVKAAEFVAHSGVSGSLFGNDVWGGYLLWQLPKTTVLSDTRGLSEEVFLNNLRIQNAEPGWEEQLLALNTSIIVVSAFDPISGNAKRLWQSLVYSPNWQLAYSDAVSLVFFRKDVVYAGPALSQQEKLVKSRDHALAQIRTLVAKYPQTPGHWGDLGQIHLLRGEVAEAINAYRKAVDLDPGNDDYRTRLQILESR